MGSVSANEMITNNNIHIMQNNNFYPTALPNPQSIVLHHGPIGYLGHPSAFMQASLDPMHVNLTMDMPPMNNNQNAVDLANPVAPIVFVPSKVARVSEPAKPQPINTGNDNSKVPMMIDSS